MKHCRLYASPVAALLLLASPALQAQCRLCADPAVPAVAPQRPLTIEVETGIDFSRVALTQPAGGAVEVAPSGGRRRVTGGLVDLGGMGLSGTVTLTGEPGRGVRVSLPDRVMLAAPEGGNAEVTGIVTDLPPMPRLGPDGRLRFAFGGLLIVQGRATGSFRGRIPIVADYE